MDNIPQNNSGMQIRKAQKSKSRLRIGLSGTSGSGKTYSALLLASGITSWDKILIIDTENGSADLYDSLGEYNVLTLQAPFTPERYIEAIHAAENAGMEVIIIDSVTHEWDGKGGILESNELLAHAKFKGNTWAAWSQSTPKHQKFINAIVSSTCHIITTARSKQETIQVDGKVKKVGTKEIQREGFEYELTLNFNIDRDTHNAISSKDRTGIFIDMDPFVISSKTGVTLKKWAEKGVDLEKVKMEEERKAREEEERKANAAKKAIIVAAKTVRELIVKKGKDEKIITDFWKVKSLEDLTMPQINKALQQLITLPDFDPSQEVDPEEAEKGIEAMKKNKCVICGSEGDHKKGCPNGNQQKAEV